MLAAGSAQARPGDLDPSFGQGGVVTTTFVQQSYVGTGASGVGLQPDGKIVAAGASCFVPDGPAEDCDFGLARYLSSGALDPTFGSGGKVTTSFGPGVDSASDVALQPDGKIVAAGSSCDGGAASCDFALARYNQDGPLDPSFGIGGKVTTSFSAERDSASGIVLQPDGKIVAAGGATCDDRNNCTFALARYNADGSLDGSFGADGKVTSSFGTGGESAADVLLQGDGRIVAAGGHLRDNDSDFTLARYKSDGSLDSTFGSGGKVTTAIGSGAGADGLVLQPDGKLVAAGWSRSPSTYDAALIRYSPDGSLDASFGNGGRVLTGIQENDYWDDVLVQADGRIVASGETTGPAAALGALAQYETDGSLDQKFGQNGTTVCCAFDGSVRALALQPDGKIVTAGDRSPSGMDGEFVLARLLGGTLTVSMAGNGSGTVSSSPAGIDCRSTCSAPFAAVPVTLEATPAEGSVFAAWSSDCSRKDACTVEMGADHTVTARFELACVVPDVKGKKLRKAKRAIRRHHCSVGRVKRVYSRHGKKGRVISQRPRGGVMRAPHSKVRVTVGKGKHHRR